MCAAGVVNFSDACEISPPPCLPNCRERLENANVPMLSTPLRCVDSLASNYAGMLLLPAARPHRKLTAGWCAVAGASTPGISAPWLCTYEVNGCGQPDADNYLSYVTVSVLSTCQYGGCIDAEAKNFDLKVKAAPPPLPLRHLRRPSLSLRVTQCAGHVQ